jgi:hypothetical protein
MLATILTAPPHALIGTLQRLLARKLANHHVGLAGATTGFIALAAAPVAGIWAILGLKLGRREETLAEAQGETV